MRRTRMIGGGVLLVGTGLFLVHAYGGRQGDVFVLTLLGVEDVAVYDGSLTEWAADPSLPLVTGDA